MPPPAIPVPKQITSTRQLVLLFALLVLLVPLSGLAIVMLYGSQIEREAYSNLEAITRLKAEQIENWLDERQGNSVVLTASAGFIQYVDQFVLQQSKASRNAIQMRFDALRTAYGYDSITLLGPDGQLQLTSGEQAEMPDNLQQLLRQSLTSKQVQRGNLYRDNAGNVHLVWVAPIFLSDERNNHAIAAVVLRATAQRFLFPLIQSWPTASASAESLLVRQDGESALFLNTLRHRVNTALLLRLPLAKTELPASIAIRAGQPGITGGFDYRGVEVLTAYRPIKGADWRLIAKIDRHEVLVPIRELVLWISLIAFIAIVAISVTLLMLWRKQRDITQRKQADAVLRASEIKLRAIINASPVSMALNDEQQNITYLNPAFIKTFGYTLEDIPTLADWWPKAYPDPDYRRVADTWRNALNKARQNGEEFAPIELNIRCKQGALKTVLASAAPLEESYAGNHLVVLYDITERKHVEQALQHSETSLKHSLEQTQLLLDAALDGVISMDDSGIVLGWNNQAELIFGVPREQAVGREVAELIVPPSYREAHRQGMARFIKTGIPTVIGKRIEVSGMRADGAEFPMELTIAALNLHGSYFFSAYVRDISERKQIENELRIAATAFESQEAMIITDANQVILKVNHAFTRITGYSAEEAIGNTPAMLKSGRQDKQFYLGMWQSLNCNKFWQGEIWNRRKNGEIYPEWLSISAVTDNHGQITHYVAAFADISQRKKAEETIHHLAFYDPLTGLANRRLLINRLQHALNASAGHINYGAVLFIDLDNFKALNDIKGHDVGDRLLIDVAKRLQACVHSNDTMARLGSDDFVVLLDKLSEESAQAAIQAEAVAEEIRSSINQPFDLQDYEYKTSPSIGISLFRNHEISVDELLKRTDAAMYQAKQSGRNTIRFFDPATHAAMAARIALETDLRRALPGDQFRLYYQAQVDSNGQILGAEVLIRWQHPEQGLVAPSQFIPLAEETGLILPIGQWVLETACAQIKAWEQKPGFQHMRLAVNVSSLQFRQPDFIEQVFTALKNSAIDPSKLKLELTESLVLEDVNDTIAKMRAIKKTGVHFSMDDFGTGYSSLAYLTQLPLDQLKIDQSFVRNIGVNPSDAVIVQTIIGMANNLGMRVIAEGVETEQQREFLERNGCTYYQGYLFGKPMPLAEFEKSV